MTGAKLLLVEDDTMISDALKYGLEKEGFLVTQAFDGQSGLESARRDSPDIILLDLMLPVLSGLEVCREIRRFSNVPVLMITARGEESDQVTGLELGADDYIVKPFGTRQLIARIRANLRRVGFQSEDEPSIETIGTVSMDFGRRIVTRDADVVHLSFREFELLTALCRARGDVVAREVLLGTVWGEDWVGDPRTLDVHIRWLREKLETDPSRPRLILTARSVGYRMVTTEELKEGESV